MSISLRLMPFFCLVLAMICLGFCIPAAAQETVPQNSPEQQEYLDIVSTLMDQAEHGATEEERQAAITQLVSIGFGREPDQTNSNYVYNPCADPTPCVGDAYETLQTRWDTLLSSDDPLIGKTFQEMTQSATATGNADLLTNLQQACSQSGNACDGLDFNAMQAQAAINRDTREGCTTDQAFDLPVKVTGAIDNVTQGNDIGQIVINVSRSVNTLMRNAAETLFRSIIGDSEFMKAIAAAEVLVLTFFAVSFMLGFTRLTAEEGVMRLFKYALIVALLAPTGWALFYDLFGKLMLDASDELINTVSAISSDIASRGQATEPCEYDTSGLVIGDAMGGLACSLNRVLSLKMLVILASLAYTGVYGIVFAVLLGFGIFMFLKAAVDAVWAYLISIVFRVVLLGLAPIFIAFFFFARTKQLFTGWLNQLVSFSLQPVFVFAFLGFFLILIEGYLNRIMHVELCLGRVPDFLQGTGFDVHLYRFMVPNSAGQLVDWQGDWGRGEDINGATIPAPLDIVDVLMFGLLSMLASSFVGIAEGLAKAVSGANPNTGTFGGMTGMIGQAMGQATNWVKAQTLGRIPYVGGVLGKGGMR